MFTTEELALQTVFKPVAKTDADFKRVSLDISELTIDGIIQDNLRDVLFTNIGSFNYLASLIDAWANGSYEQAQKMCTSYVDSFANLLGFMKGSSPKLHNYTVAEIEHIAAGLKQFYLTEFEYIAEMKKKNNEGCDFSTELNTFVNNIKSMTMTIGQQKLEVHDSASVASYLRENYNRLFRKSPPQPSVAITGTPSGNTASSYGT